MASSMEEQSLDLTTCLHLLRVLRFEGAQTEVPSLLAHFLPRLFEG